MLLLGGFQPAPASSTAFTLFDQAACWSAWTNAFYYTDAQGGHFRDIEGTTDAMAFWKLAEAIEVVESATNGNFPVVTNMVNALCEGFTNQWGQNWTWNTYNDDIMWASVCFNRAYQLTGNRTYLTLAQNGFDFAFNRGWNTNGGGIFQDTADTTNVSGQCTCADGPAADAAFLLYTNLNGLTSTNTYYLAKAQQIYNWMVTNVYNVTNGEVEGGPGSGDYWTYDQGTFATIAFWLGDTTRADAVGDFVESHWGVNMQSFGFGSNGGPMNGICLRGLARTGHNISFLQACCENAWSWQNIRGLTPTDWASRTADTNLLHCSDCMSQVAGMLSLPPSVPDTLPVTAADVVGSQVTFNAAFGGGNPYLGLPANYYGVNFTAAIGGNMTYQWQKISGGVTNNIPGATNTTLTLSNLQLTNTASYQLQASNAVGVVVSTPASLTVSNVPAAVNNVIISRAAQTAGGYGFGLSPTWTIAPGSIIYWQFPSSSTGNFNQETGWGNRNVNTLTTGGGLAVCPGGSPTTTSVNYVACGEGAGQTIIYTLTNTSAGGYNLTNITVYGGWKDNGRDQQQYTVDYSTVSAPTTFISLASVNYTPANPANETCATRATLTPASGWLATNVAAVKFDFTAQSSYLGYAQIALYGTPLSPVTNVTYKIALVDQETNNSAFTTTLLLATNLTVSPSANTLVVEVVWRNAVSATEAPPTLNWTNATTTNTLNLAVQRASKATGGRASAIYYCYNPTAGAGYNISGALGSGSAGLLVAYTLSGVDTIDTTVVPPPKNSVSVTGSGATSISFTMNGITGSSWAAVAGAVATAINNTVTVTNGVATGSPVLTTGNNDSADFATHPTSTAMGYISTIAGGSDLFTYQYAAPNNSDASFSAVIFAPPPPTPPIIGTGPTPVSVYPGQTAQFSAEISSGANPMSNRWTTNGVTLADGTQADGAVISGSGTTTLTISNVTAAEALDYVLTVTNVYGGTNTIAADGALTVLTPGPATNFTLNYGGAPIVQGSGLDWNTVTNWNPFGQSAAFSMYANPGSTYELPVGSRLRTPAASSLQVFPGIQLMVDGSGVFENDSANPTNVSELRFKGPTTDSTNYFSNLVLNGGQLDQGLADANPIQDIEGMITVSNNSAIYVDSTSTADRGYQIDSWLTGSGNLFWHQWSGALGGVDMQITCTTNTFSGQWIVDQGALVGVGANSLGANNIIVGTNGLTAAVETLYNINDTNASLILGANGQMFLHQTNHFASVIINGTSLANGTYPFATLNSTYPANFPLRWAQQAGSTFTTGSGEIIVGNLVGPPSMPHITHIGLSGTSLSLSATNGTAGGSWELLQSTNVALSLSQWQTNLMGNFDGSGNLSTNIVNTATNRQKFYILKVQ
jgi:hypothetical protein